MKICPRCNTRKPLKDFGLSRNRKDGRQVYCRPCKKEGDAASYRLRTEFHKRLVRERQKRLREENFQKLLHYLETHPCLDCGESDPTVLEFDHVRGQKRAAISVLVSRHGWFSVEAEIKKCEVRCANCHRRKTIQRARNIRSTWLNLS